RGAGGCGSGDGSLVRHGGDKAETPATFRLVSQVPLGQGAAGSGSECKLRAAQRLLVEKGARARVQGQGGGGRRTWPTTALGRIEVPVATCHPTSHLRPGPADRSTQDLASRAVRA